MQTIRPVVAACALLVAWVAGADEYAEAVQKLARQAGAAQPPVKVAVYPFPCAVAGHEGISHLSAELEDRLRAALAEDPGFAVITRQDLDKLVKEQDLQSSGLVDPESFTKVRLEGVDGHVRGRWTYRPGVVTVTTVLTLLDGGRECTAVLDLPHRIPALDRPAAAPESADLPANVAQQGMNRKKLAAVLAELPGRDFGVELWVDGGRSHFAGGEKITYLLRARRDCHVALFCHQVDGTTVQLFPNRFCRDTAIRAGRIVRVPDRNGEKQGFVFRIQEPYGADIVQVIACTNAAELRRVIANIDKIKGIRYRGQGVFADLGAGGEDDHDDDGPVQWGEAHFTVHSYPAR